MNWVVARVHLLTCSFLGSVYSLYSDVLPCHMHLNQQRKERNLCVNVVEMCRIRKYAGVSEASFQAPPQLLVHITKKLRRIRGPSYVSVYCMLVRTWKKRSEGLCCFSFHLFPIRFCSNWGHQFAFRPQCVAKVVQCPCPVLLIVYNTIKFLPKKALHASSSKREDGNLATVTTCP